MFLSFVYPDTVLLVRVGGCSIDRKTPTGRTRGKNDAAVEAGKYQQTSAPANGRVELTGVYRWHEEDGLL